MKILKIKTAILSAILIILMVVVVTAVDSGENAIASVRLNKAATDITIAVTLKKEYVNAHASEKLYVFAFEPWQSTSNVSEMTPVADFKASEKASVRIAYQNGNASRLYDKFAVAQKNADGSYQLITNAKYIDNLSDIADNTEEIISTNKKGMIFSHFTDAQNLGIAHTVIEIPLNDYIVGENNASSASFIFNGQTYYINKDKIAILDHIIKIYSEAGIMVYLNLVLTTPETAISDTVRSFYHDNAYAYASSYARYYALNTRNEVAMKNFIAFADYLAARYTRADHAYGFAPNFILGYQMNQASTCNVGVSNMEESIYTYCTAFRAAYTAMVSHCQNGRVYLSLANNWESAETVPGVTADPRYEYAGRAFLDFFAEVMSAAGDIPWGLSVNPYPSDSQMTDYWNDSYADYDSDTPYLTMKNLKVLTGYMNRAEKLYDKECRSIIIGSFGVPAVADNAEAVLKQAAAYALAYYATALNDDIDAFIWDCQVDSADGSHLCGILTAGYQKKSQIYSVVAGIDTDRSAEVTNFVKATVGSGAWGQIIDAKTNFADFAVRTTSTMTVATEEDITLEKGLHAKTLLDLTKGNLCGFYPSDSASYVELKQSDESGHSVLYAELTGIPSEYSGIGSVVKNQDFTKAKYLTVKVKADAPDGVEKLNFMVRLQHTGDRQENTVVSDGAVSLRVGEWQTVVFDIHDITAKSNGDIDVIKLWVKTNEGETTDGTYALWVENIGLQVKGGSVIGVVLWVLGIAVVVGIGGYVALYVRAERIRRKSRMARRQQAQNPMHNTGAVPNVNRGQMSNTGYIPTVNRGQMSNTGYIPTVNRGQMSNTGYIPTVNRGQMNNTGYISTVNRGQMNNTGYIPTVNRGQMNNTGYIPTVNRGQMNNTGYIPTVNRGQMSNTGYIPTVNRGQVQKPSTLQTGQPSTVQTKKTALPAAKPQASSTAKPTVTPKNGQTNKK